METQIWRLVRPKLQGRVRSCAPTEDLDVIETAVDDALLLYFAAPARYDSKRGDPIAWLATIARRKVRDAIRTRRRRLAHEVAVGLEVGPGSSVPEARDDGEEAAELTERRRLLMAVAWTNEEKAFLKARLNGLPIPTQAAALGANHLSLRDQKTLVHRTWNRLHNRLRFKRFRRLSP